MTTEELLRKGKALTHQGKYSAATEYFQEIVCGDESNLDAWKGLEEAYRNLGKFDKAQECAEKVRQLTLVLPKKVQNPAQSNKTATHGRTFSHQPKTSDAKNNKRWAIALIVVNVFYLVSSFISIIADTFADRYVDWFPSGCVIVLVVLELLLFVIIPSINPYLLKGFEDESDSRIYCTISTLVCTIVFSFFAILLVDGLSREKKEKNRVKYYREKAQQEKEEIMQAVEGAKHSEQKQKKLFCGLCFGMTQKEVDSVLNSELPLYIYISTTDSERVSVDTAFFHGELYEVVLSSRASLENLLLRDVGYQKYRMNSDGDSMFVIDNLIVESRHGGYQNTLSYINAPILLAIKEEENAAKEQERIADSIRQDRIREETLRQQDIERRDKLRLDSINKARFKRTR